MKNLIDRPHYMEQLIQHKDIDLVNEYRGSKRTYDKPIGNH